MRIVDVLCDIDNHSSLSTASKNGIPGFIIRIGKVARNINDNYTKQEIDYELKCAAARLVNHIVYHEKYTSKMTVFNDVHEECMRQVTKWGVQTHFDHVWLSILMEEVGEFQSDYESFELRYKRHKNPGSKSRDVEFGKSYNEAIQCIAVIASWLSDDERKDKEVDD